MSDSRAIGVFDSGIGGLTLVRELFRFMPDEKIVYLGDTARCPYGGRSKETVTNFGIQDADFLVSKDIKMLIVACNTVSAVALSTIQERIKNIPVIGVVFPGSKAALLQTAEKKIGVIGTRATVGTKAYEKAIKNIDDSIKVYSKPCPLFVPLAEEGMFNHEITTRVAEYYLYELVDIGIDCLILGCTHYPLLLEAILSVVGTNIQLIDSAFWTAKEAEDIINVLKIKNMDKNNGSSMSEFYVTDLQPGYQELISRFLGKKVENIQRISLESISEA